MVEIIINLAVQFVVFFLYQYAIDVTSFYDISSAMTKKWGITFSYDTKHQQLFSHLQENSKREWSSPLIIIISVVTFASFGDALQNVVDDPAFRFLGAILVPIMVCAFIFMIIQKFFSFPTFDTWLKENHVELFQKTEKDIVNKQEFSETILSLHYLYLKQYDAVVIRKRNIYDILKVVIFIMVIWLFSKWF